MQKLIHFSRDQSGEGYIDLAIVVLVIFVLMAMLLSVYPIFTVQQSLNSTVRHITRTVVNGRVKYRIFGSSSTKNSAIKMQSFRQWKYKDFGNGFACSNSNIPGGVRSS